MMVKNPLLFREFRKNSKNINLLITGVDFPFPPYLKNTVWMQKGKYPEESVFYLPRPPMETKIEIEHVKYG